MDSLRSTLAFSLSTVLLGLLGHARPVPVSADKQLRNGDCDQEHTDPDTEPDSSTDPQEPDEYDGVFDPEAWHDVQHFEWLGVQVDQEIEVTDDDSLIGKMGDDDGLLDGEVAGGAVDLRIRISTSYADHPDAFPAGCRLYVDAWVDWDDDFRFEGSEHVGVWSGAPPFNGSDDREIVIVGSALGNPPGDYNVRLRLDYHDPGHPHVSNPEGDADGVGAAGNSYGEVEDYRHYPLEQDAFAAPGASPRAVAGLVLVLGILGVLFLHRR